jgi:hypothetical protein
MFFLLIHSHLIYGIHLWSTAVLLSVTNIITSKQKTALRVISNAKYNAHKEHILIL